MNRTERPHPLERPRRLLPQGMATAVLRPAYALVLAALLIASTTGSAAAQSVSRDTPPRDSKYGLEADILWPVFPGSFRSHFTVRLFQKGDLRGDAYVGVNVDFPRNRDTEGRFSDYSVASGYRQYLWKGLHAEFSQTLGLGVLDNHVTTKQNYRSFDWLITGYVGYRFNLARSRFYIMPQFGVANVVSKSDPWPIYENKTLTKEVGERPFPLGSLRFGYSF